MAEAVVLARPDELRRELIVAFAVLTNANGASGEFPEGAVNTL